ncbi:MAG: DUF3467 domain-containing protein [Bryobacteraceae bacterium]
MAEQETQPVADEIIRSDRFVSAYANNVKFELSIWDVKILFGEVLKYGSPSVVQQHAVMTVPWLQAKAMALFLSINVASHEEIDGPIRIPGVLLGPALQSFANRDITLEQIFEEFIKDRKAPAAAQPPSEPDNQ